MQKVAGSGLATWRILSHIGQTPGLPDRILQPSDPPIIKKWSRKWKPKRPNENFEKAKVSIAQSATAVSQDAAREKQRVATMDSLEKKQKEDLSKDPLIGKTVRTFMQFSDDANDEAEVTGKIIMAYRHNPELAVPPYKVNVIRV